MDEILQRMLTVERRAEAIVKDAEAEAERIASEGRQKASDLKAGLLAETQEAAESCVASRIEEAEREKVAALSRAEDELKRRSERFEQVVLGRRSRIKDELAYPYLGEA